MKYPSNRKIAKRKKKKESESTLYHYQSYEFEKTELILEIARAVIQVMITGILFFRSWCHTFSTDTLDFKKTKREKKEKEKAGASDRF